MGPLDRSFHDVSYPNQVVSGGGEREHPADSVAAAMLGLAQTGGGLDPAKDLLHELAFLLAVAIPIVACGAFVNAARTSGSVLRHMRRDGVLPQAVDKIESVVTFIRAQRDTFVAARQM